MHKINIQNLCKIAKISTSGFYRWQKNKDNRYLKDKNDVEIIKNIFEQQKEKAGWRVIKMIMEREYGIKINHKKIRRIKSEYGLNTKIRQKNKHRAAFKKMQNSCICSNILNRNFNQNQPNKAFSTDITYLFYSKNQAAYLSTIKDLGSKEIVAYELSKRNNLDLVINTIEKIPSVIPKTQLKSAILHSDQGFQYTHPLVSSKIADLRMLQSMSRRGNCLDNAPIESFFGHLKDEVDYKDCKTFEELQDKIDKFIYYYNNNRYQWSLNKMTPREYKYHLLTA